MRKIRNINSSFCKKCLYSSLPVDMMIRFAGLANPDYNFYYRAGLREGMPISNQDAAHRIVADMIHDGYYVDFVETLIKVDNEGFMGSQYDLRGLDTVINAVIKEGYNYDEFSGCFFENQEESISPNWGRLHDGDERKMTVLRLDIAGNSALVKNNPHDKIDTAYDDIRDIVYRAVTSRMGRLWTWEGDGTLAAFLFGPIEKLAIYAGMEILHELFFYNRLRNPLDSPINVRIGAHIGQVRYSNNEIERLKNDTVKQVIALESMACGNSLGVSYNLYIAMDTNTLSLFGKENSGRAGKYRLYSFGLEK
jgi:class 3 adenylate cyclase